MIKGVKQSRGFSMVELIVVVAILAIVIFTATDLFVSMVKNQKRTLIQQELLNQTSYVAEYMSRAIRVAKKDDVGACIPVGTNYEATQDGRGIKFINHSNNDICQEFVWDAITQRIQESKDGGTTFTFLSSDSLQVNDFQLQILGDVMGDNQQPRVTVFMDIQHKGNDPNEPRQKLQTTISQRNLDE